MFRALCKIGTEESVNAVLGYVTNDDELLRALAAENLHHVKFLPYVKLENQELEKKVVKALIKALSDSDKDVKWFAIRSSSWFMDLEILPHLEKIAENDEDEDNRKAAKDAIEQIKENKETYDSLYGNKKNNDENGEK